ncbi:MAG: AMP-binding protein [Alphaproteobacteria bacterium]|jgi:fatty-acyl-CoA synthase|nr:AMP-binding protein [Alphaproteobacteria bacterium]MBT4086708.1 AMP-binding protein [Alphaproteobacteria bacterium]MBT4545366.1 AMP-binding protein [Alphaproteobacteria bacterium]MBT5917158.1 AMP-binding protein [Alphaproteobacteria bacterium]MBT6387073.1 AMP-binding protein [Alphaproteobacteria bacterium]
MISAMNLGRLLSDTARLYPDLIGLVHGDEEWTWAQLDANASAFRDALMKMGVNKGDRVMVQSRNNRAMFESLWGIFKAGAVWVPSNFRQTPPEIAYVASNSGARAFLFEGVFAEHAAAAKESSGDLEYLISIGGSADDGTFDYDQLLADNAGAAAMEVAVEYSDPAWLFYTSGTTGRPKGAILTHGQMSFVTNNFMADLMPDLTKDDASIVVAPLSHGAGCHVFPQVVRGAKSVLMPGESMDPETVWQLVEKYRVSNAFTVPTIVKMLVEHPSVDKYDHSSLRHVIHAGAPMYLEDQKTAYEKLGPVLVEYYGQGEVTGCITVLRPEHYIIDENDPRNRPGTCGLPRVGLEIAIRDTEGNILPAGEQGEICCKGPAVMAGYWENDKANAEVFQDGWFHTGDLGRVDDAGFVYITGRAKDMFISGGANVYPREIEEVMLTHPGVSEVAVLGIPDTKWGEVGVAVVVPTDQGITAEELAGFINKELSRYKHPKKYVFWDDLPKSGYGKVPKHLIRNTLYERGDLVEGQDL